MLHEFVILPEVFDESAFQKDPTLGVKLLELLKGILANGTLTDVHPASGARVITPQRVRRLPQNIRKDVESYLKLIRDQGCIMAEYLTLGSPPPADDDGLEEAILRSCAATGFDGIVVSLDVIPEERRDNLRWVKLAKLLESEPWKASRRRTQALSQNRGEYGRLLPSVLRHAAEVVLIDPYLSCEQDKCWNLLKLIEEIILARPGSSRASTITIHAEALYDDPERMRREASPWKGKLEQLVRSELYIKRCVVNFWRQRDGSDRKMHDRYIMTERAGIIVPNGLECYSSGGNTTVWALMEPDDRKRVLAEYRDNGQPFKLVYTLTVPDSP